MKDELWITEQGRALHKMLEEARSRYIGKRVVRVRGHFKGRLCRVTGVTVHMGLYGPCLAFMAQPYRRGRAGDLLLWDPVEARQYLPASDLAWPTGGET